MDWNIITWGRHILLLSDVDKRLWWSKGRRMWTQVGNLRLLAFPFNQRLTLFCLGFFPFVSRGGGVGWQKVPPCISKSIDAMEMKLIWCVKHPKLFKLVTVTCQLWRHTRHNEVIHLKNPPPWFLNLGFLNCSEMSEDFGRISSWKAKISKNPPNLGKTICISKSIRAIKMKLMWCIKHSIKHVYFSDNYESIMI